MKPFGNVLDSLRVIKSDHEINRCEFQVRSDEDEYREFRGIGIRIEEDAAITKDGSLVLSVEAPKEIVDIETVMSSKQRAFP